MTDFFEHQKLSFRKSYLRTLIHLAFIDGEIDECERQVLYKIGQDRNLKAWQIEMLLNDTSPFKILIPESFSNKMNLLFDLMRLLFADGVVDEKEVAYVKYVISSFHLSPSVFTELLILFKDGTPTLQVWRRFTESLTPAVPEKRALTIL